MDTRTSYLGMRLEHPIAVGLRMEILQASHRTTAASASGTP